MQQLLLKALERATKKVRSWGSKEESPTPVLLPLTPKFDRTKHGVYLDIIEAALNDPAHPAARYRWCDIRIRRDG